MADQFHAGTEVKTCAEILRLHLIRYGTRDIPGSVADQVKAKNFSAGLNFGAGVELISHLQVGFNYGLGLTDNYSIEKVNLSDGAGKNRGWSITAAILF